MEEKLKTFIGFGLGLLLIALSWCAFKGALFLESARETAESATLLINEAKPKVNNTLDSIESSSKAVERVSNAQADMLLDKKTATKIGVLVRKADNLARAIDHIESITAKVDKDTLPATNKAINSTTLVLYSANNLLNTTNKQIDGLGDKAQEDLEALRQVLADENLKRLLGNLADTSASVKQTAEHIEATSQELRQALPELIAELKSISKHTDDSTGEIATFLATLNKPQTKKQKLFRYLIQAAITAAPYAIRR